MKWWPWGTDRTPKGTSITFEISGMHCTGCAMNITGELEDLPGVLEASTNYAKSTCAVLFDPQKVKESTLKKVIEEQGYQATKRAEVSL